MPERPRLPDNIADLTYIDGICANSKENYSALSGYFCSYFPVELLYGFNILPVRILGYSESAVRKRKLINYMCAYLSDVINSFETGKFQWADFLIVPATCDSLYGACDYIETPVQ